MFEPPKDHFIRRAWWLPWAMTIALPLGLHARGRGLASRRRAARPHSRLLVAQAVRGQLDRLPMHVAAHDHRPTPTARSVTAERRGRRVVGHATSHRAGGPKAPAWPRAGAGELRGDHAKARTGTAPDRFVLLRLDRNPRACHGGV